MPPKPPKKPKKHPKTTPCFKPRRIKIKVVGLGGGGSSIVCEMAQTLKAPTFVLADTDARVFKKVHSSPSSLRGAKRRSNLKVFQFGEKLVGGMGTGMNPELAQRAAEAEKEKIAKIFQGQDLVILIGSLGGGVCSGAGPVFAAVAREQKTISLGIFTLPFAFEGEKKNKVAKKALAGLQENLSGIIVVPNEKIFHICDKKIPLKKALSVLNQTFAQWLYDLINLILKPNLINIDFADLRTILKEHGKTLFFSRGVAQGPNRGEEALKKIFENPLASLDGQAPKRILFNIAGGKDLKLKEVEAISQAVANLNPRAKIIFGISEIPQYKGKLKITLLAVNDAFPKPKSASPGPADESGARQKEPVKTSKHPSKTVTLLCDRTKVLQKKKGLKAGKKAGKKAARQKIRRSALEIKKADEEQKEREWAQEPEWQVPTFLRRKIK